jgi:hypothetical protein
VNETEQAAGAEYAATVVDRSESDDRDSITYDLAGAYPDEAGLDALHRTVELDRAAERVDVTDEVTFAEDAPGDDWTSILVSWQPIEEASGGLVVDGDAVSTTVSVEDGADIRVERLEDAIDVTGHTTDDTDFRDVWRARIDAAGDRLGLRIDPSR